MANYILELPLSVEKWQADILNKRFEIGRRMYNALLNKTKRRYNKMIRDRQYIDLFKSLTDDKESNKPIWEQINNIREEYKLSKAGLEEEIKVLQYHYKKNIDSATAQKIANRLWTAYEDFFFGDGEELHYKKFGTFNSLESKSNSAGIKYRGGTIVWNKLELKTIVKRNDKYAVEALKSDISFCRLVRKEIRGRYKYYIQLVLKGIPPSDIKLGKGSVGLDIGPSTLAYASKTEAGIVELADKVERMENKLTSLQQQMDRSLRANNPGNYNLDGTIKEGKRLTWVKSKRYRRLQSECNETKRKQAAVRKYQHECLANKILSLGDTFYVEDMDFKELAKRSDEKSEYFNSKSRFGKSIGNRAPAMLIIIIERKLSYFDKQLNRIDTYKAKASQYNHLTGEYKKKPLSQRWAVVGNNLVQRDLYSAYLIQNTNKTLDGFNTRKCKLNFNKFLVLHEDAISKLINNTTLKSIGI